jgi:aryl-alcohol dehydrogenase-like predicted oxidoreductase
MQTRRKFLTSVVGAAGTLSVSPATLAEKPSDWPNKQGGMAYRRLGRTGFMVSEMVMGGTSVAPDKFDFVLEAVDRGLNYLDTAPAYGKGRSEAGLAQVIRARGRDKFFVTTKVSLWDLNRNKLFQDIFESLSISQQKKLKRRAQEEIEKRRAAKPDNFVDYFTGQINELEAAALSNVMEKEYGRQIDRKKNYRELILNSIDESLTRLGTDYVDIMMCPHGANTPFELLNFPEIREAFEILKRAGKVRYLGVSAHTDSAGVLEAALEAQCYSMAMVAYNLINHKYVENSLRIAHENDLGVIAMKVARPFCPGRGDPDPGRLKILEEALKGSFSVPQKAYLWALQNKGLSGVISSMDSAEMVEANLSLFGG